MIKKSIVKKKLPNKKADKGEYKVGNCKPPKEHQFKKGEIHNPKGRPPKIKYISELLREKIEEICGKEVCEDEDKFKNILDGVYKVGTEEITFGKILVSAMLKHSLKGNSAMLKELLDRTEGKLTQPLSGDEDRPPIEIRVTNVNTKKLLK